MTARNLHDENPELASLMAELKREAERHSQENPGLFRNVPAGAMTIREALLSDNPLDNIMNEMGEAPIHRTLILLHAASQEVFSAGAGILFDRYTPEEIRVMVDSYRELGADSFCLAMDRYQTFFREKLGDSWSDDDLFDLCDTDEYAALDRELTLQYEAMNLEMEKALLTFVERHLDELEAI